MKSITILGFLFLMLSTKAQITIDSIWVSSNPICIDGSGTAIVYASPVGNYFYQWSFPGTLNNSGNDTTGFIPSNSGNQILIIEVSDGFGNSAIDSIQISVHEISSFAAFPATSTVHCGESVQLNTNLSSSGQNIISVGNSTGANSEYTYPAPFANWYANAKQQYLFHASELASMGISAGNILGLNFPINLIAGLVTYPNYTIRMGNTSATTLTTTFSPVDPTILFQQNFTIQSGNNNIVFTTPFLWNGTDNVIIEICYDWVAQYNYTLNSITPWTTTSFNSSAWFNSDGVAACPQLIGYGTSTNRPLTGFIINQSSTLGPISYLWEPSTTLSANNISNPVANTTTDTWYTVTATDSICWAQDSVHVLIDSSYTFNLMQYPSQVCQGSTVNPYLQQQWMDNWLWTIENNGITTSSSTNLSIQYDSIGVFGLVLSGTTLCGVPVQIVDSINVVSNQPVLVLNVPIDTFCTNQTVTLDAIGSYGNVVWSYKINNVPQSQLGYFLTYVNSIVGSDVVTVSASFCNNSVDTTFTLYFVDCLNVEESEFEKIEIINLGNSIQIHDALKQKKEIYLFNAEGKLIQSLNSYENVTPISIEHLSSGIYFVEVLAANSQFRKKIIR